MRRTGSLRRWFGSRQPPPRAALGRESVRLPDSIPRLHVADQPLLGYELALLRATARPWRLRLPPHILASPRHHRFLPRRRGGRSYQPTLHARALARPVRPPTADP